MNRFIWNLDTNQVQELLQKATPDPKGLVYSPKFTCFGVEWRILILPTSSEVGVYLEPVTRTEKVVEFGIEIAFPEIPLFFRKHLTPTELSSVYTKTDDYMFDPVVHDFSEGSALGCMISVDDLSSLSEFGVKFSLFFMGKACGHKCELTTACCICDDKRTGEIFVGYLDGKRKLNVDKNEHYCPCCKKFESPVPRAKVEKVDVERRHRVLRNRTVYY